MNPVPGQRSGLHFLKQVDVELTPFNTDRLHLVSLGGIASPNSTAESRKWSSSVDGARNTLGRDQVVLIVVGENNNHWETQYHDQALWIPFPPSQQLGYCQHQNDPLLSRYTIACLTPNSGPSTFRPHCNPFPAPRNDC